MTRGRFDPRAWTKARKTAAVSYAEVYAYLHAKLGDEAPTPTTLRRWAMGQGQPLSLLVPLLAEAVGATTSEVTTP